jgi:hypothetical protein
MSNVSGTATPRVAFVTPSFDLLAVGGALSLVVGLLIIVTHNRWNEEDLWALLLVINGAHFAASTLRLYTREKPIRRWPILTLVFPLFMIGLTTLLLGPWFRFAQIHLAVYSVWSPYHYAAQAFGLSMMYSHRASCALGLRERRMVRLACLLPFVVSIAAPRAATWLFFGPRVYAAQIPVTTALSPFLRTAALAMPLLVFGYLRFRAKVRVPFIAFLLVASNAVWWSVFDPMHAFIWATIAHSLQYLAIVLFFHVRERVARAENKLPGIIHIALFYGGCLMLAIVLFEIWPLLYDRQGFHPRMAGAVVFASVNIHHFVVDAFIWKIRKDSNSKVVGGTASEPPAVAPSEPVSAAA